jgi:hypothetical protein
VTAAGASPEIATHFGGVGGRDGLSGNLRLGFVDDSRRAIVNGDLREGLDSRRRFTFLSRRFGWRQLDRRGAAFKLLAFAEF